MNISITLNVKRLISYKILKLVYWKDFMLRHLFNTPFGLYNEYVPLFIHIAEAELTTIINPLEIGDFDDNFH